MLRLIIALSYGPLLPLMILGGWLFLKQCPATHRVILLLPIMATVLAALVYYGSARFRSPIEPFLLVLAATAIVRLMSGGRLTSRSRRRVMNAGLHPSRCESDVAGEEIMGLFARRDSEDLEAYFNACREHLLRDLTEHSHPRFLTDAVAGLEVRRALDVGCGIGQTLFFLAAGRGVSGIGLDVSDQAIRLGREFQAGHLPEAPVSFIRARAESLPFPPASFDLVVCRLALPYTNNAQALAEMARVLRPGGLLLLRIHHLRYYLRQFGRALISLRLRSLLHALRVLVGGACYHLTGRQPRLRWLSETFQTRWLLRRELAGSSLAIVRELPDSTPHAPDFVIHKGRASGREEV